MKWYVSQEANVVILTHFYYPWMGPKYVGTVVTMRASEE